MAILQNSLWAPPDRDLALRGQIKTGWSTLAVRKPNRYIANGAGELTDEEIEAIQTVISKADVLERKEQIRIGLLSLQYEQLCSNARGNGDTSCIICGYDFAVPKSRVTIQLHLCQACTRAVCSRCKADYKQSSGCTTVLCRLCYDSRELWKKSGAWLMNGSLPPVVTVSKEELEKIQMSLRPSINNKRAQECPSPLLSQEPQNSDDEMDQSYVGLRSSLRVTVKSSQEEEGSALTYPLYHRKRGEAQGLSRRRVIKKKSPRGSIVGGQSSASGDAGGRGGSNSSSSSTLDGVGGVILSCTPTYQHRSREGTPQIVIDAPTPDITCSSADLVQATSVLSNAQQSSRPATVGRVEEDPKLAVMPSAASLPTGNVSEPSPGDPKDQGSPPDEGIARLDDDGFHPHHRRSRVIRKRPGATSHSKSTEGLATSVSVGTTGSTFEGVNNIVESPEHRDSRSLDAQPGAIVRPSEVLTTQEEDNNGFKKTRPRLHAAVGQDVGVIPTGENRVMASSRGRVSPADGMVGDSEFKRVMVTGSPEGAIGHDPAEKEVTCTKTAEDNEFRKVKLSPSPNRRATSDVNISHGSEDSPVGTGSEFRKVKLNASSHQIAIDVNVGSGSGEKFSVNGSNTSDVNVLPGGEEISQVGSGEEFKRVSEKLTEFRSTQQVPSRNEEPQVQVDNHSKTEKGENTLHNPPSSGALSQGSLSRDSVSENTPSVQNVTKRKVIESFQRFSPEIMTPENGGVKEQYTIDSSKMSQGSNPLTEVPFGSLEGVDEKRGTARLQPSTSGTPEETSVEMATSASCVQLESSVQEGEEDKLQASQGTDDEPQEDEELKRPHNNRQRPQWKRRQVVSRRIKSNDEDDLELGPRPRSRVISATSDGSPLSRRHLFQSHDNASSARDDV